MCMVNVVVSIVGMAWVGVRVGVRVCVCMRMSVDEVPMGVLMSVDMIVGVRVSLLVELVRAVSMGVLLVVGM